MLVLRPTLPLEQAASGRSFCTDGKVSGCRHSRVALTMGCTLLRARSRLQLSARYG